MNSEIHMNEELFFDGKSFVSAKQLAASFSYTPDHLSRLCRLGKISCRLVGKSWFVDPLSIGKYRDELSSVKKDDVADTALESPEVVEKVEEKENITIPEVESKALKSDVVVTANNSWDSLLFSDIPSGNGRGKNTLHSLPETQGEKTPVPEISKILDARPDLHTDKVGPLLEKASPFFRTIPDNTKNNFSVLPSLAKNETIAKDEIKIPPPFQEKEEVPPQTIFPKTILPESSERKSFSRIRSPLLSDSFMKTTGTIVVVIGLFFVGNSLVTFAKNTIPLSSLAEDAKKVFEGASITIGALANASHTLLSNMSSSDPFTTSDFLALKKNKGNEKWISDASLAEVFSRNVLSGLSAVTENALELITLGANELSKNVQEVVTAIKPSSFLDRIALSVYRTVNDIAKTTGDGAKYITQSLLGEGAPQITENQTPLPPPPAQTPFIDSQQQKQMQKEVTTLKSQGVVAETPVTVPPSVGELRKAVQEIFSQNPSLILPRPSAAVLTVGNAGVLTEAQVDSRIANLANTLRGEIARVADTGTVRTVAVEHTVALSNRINQLEDATLRNITVSTVSGLTDADIPNDITAANYLSLYTSNTMNGLLTVPSISATSTIATSTFSGGLSVGNTGSNGVLDVLRGSANTTGGANPNDSTIFVAGPDISATTTVGPGNLTIQSNTYQETDMGGLLAFGGRNTNGSSNSVNWAWIKGAKENNTSSQSIGYLSFFTRTVSAIVGERMRITSGGNIGIGTTTSTTGGPRLSVQGAGLFTDYVVAPTFTATSTLTFSTFPYASTTALSSTGSAYFALTQGSVGIGTTSPGTTLAVQGSGLFTNYVSATVFNATSTIATSTFAGGATFAGSSVGIGTTTPRSQFDVVVGGNGNTAGDIVGNIMLTAPNKLLTSGTGNLFIQTNDAFAVDLGGTIALGGRYSSTVATDGAFFAGIRGAKENGTSGSLLGYLAFTTRGSSMAERMRIDSNGFVGIGTTTPGATLSVTNTGVNPSFWVSDQADPDQTPFMIDAAGLVGIGTTSPQDNLTIAVAGGANILLRDMNAAGDAKTFRIRSTNGTAFFEQTNDAYSQLNTAMAINLTSRFVGVGSTTPSRLLSVSSGASGAGWGNGSNLVVESAGRAAISLSFPNANDGYLYFSDVDAVNRGFVGYTGSAASNADQMIFQTAGTFNFSGGNVGIGTSTPGARLAVQGAGLFTGYVSATLFNATSTLSFSTFPYASSTALSSTGSAYFATSQGNVGIGTTTPKGQLSIEMGGDPYPVWIGDNGTSSPSFAITGYGGVEIGNRNDNSAFALDVTGAISTTGNIQVGAASCLAFGAVSQGTICRNGSTGDLYMSLQSGGKKFGIATDTPFGLLSIEQGTETASLWIGNTGSTSPALVVRGVNGNGYVGIGTDTPSYLLTVGNNFGSNPPIGIVAEFENSTGSCFVNPNNAFTGCTSDARLKTNVRTLTPDLDKVLALNPVTFTWISDGSNAPTHIGFIAQEVQALFPDLVLMPKDGYFALNYAGFAPYLTSAIQELAKKLENLDTRVATLEALVASSTPSSSGLTLSGVVDYLTSLGTRVAEGITYVKKLVVGTSAEPSGITLYDKVTHEPYCVEIANGALIQSVGACGASTTPPPAPPADTEAPVIVILGANPATVSLNSSYSDNGATVTDNVDAGLGYRMFLDNMLVTEISLDTTASSTHMIDYVATDNAHNTATSTRTVIVQ